MLANVSDLGDKIKITILKDISNANAEELKMLFKEETKKNKNIVLDLTRVKTVSSSGIGKILMLQKNLKQNGKTVEIEGISNTLYEMFKLIELDALIPIKV